jgi:hypothetical protein
MADFSKVGSKPVGGLVLPADSALVPAGAGPAATVPAHTLSAATLAHNTCRIFKASVLS